jgi:hypothetical protein
VEFHVAIVGGVKCDLGTAVTHLNTLKCCMSLHISDLDQEGMYALVLSLTYEFCVKNTVSSRLAETSRPEFDALDVWSMENEFLRIRIKSCCRLQILDVGAMADLGLRISSRNLELSNQRKPLLGLVFRGQ